MTQTQTDTEEKFAKKLRRAWRNPKISPRSLEMVMETDRRLAKAKGQEYNLTLEEAREEELDAERRYTGEAIEGFAGAITQADKSVKRGSYSDYSSVANLLKVALGNFFEDRGGEFGIIIGPKSYINKGVAKKALQLVEKRVRVIHPNEQMKDVDWYSNPAEGSSIDWVRYVVEEARKRV